MEYPEWRFPGREITHFLRKDRRVMGALGTSDLTWK